MNKRGAAGFTTIELLVAIVVMGVVTTLATVAFFQMTTVWGDMTTRASLDREAEQILEAMRQDFADLMAPGISSVTIRGESRLTGGVNQMANDRVIIPVQAVTEQGLRGNASVMYSVAQRDAEFGSGKLLRSIGELGAASVEETGAPLVTAEVLRFRVEYLNAAGEWQPLWDRETPPRAVRVSLALVDDSRFYEQVSRKAVFPIHVR